MKSVHLLFLLFILCYGCIEQTPQSTLIIQEPENRDELIKQEQVLLNDLSNASRKQHKTILFQLIEIYKFQDKLGIPTAIDKGVRKGNELLNGHSLSQEERWQVLKQQALLLNEQGKQEEYLPIWYQLLEEHRAANKTQLTIEDYTTIASHFNKLSDYEQGIPLYKKAYQLTKENQFSDLQKQCFIELINLLYDSGRYKEVLDSCSHTNIDSFVTTLSSIHSVQAKCHLQLHQPDSARFYLGKMLTAANQQGKISFYCRMAETYISEEKEDSATHYFGKAVTQYKEQTKNNANQPLPSMFLPVYSAYASLLLKNKKVQEAKDVFVLITPLMRESTKEAIKMEKQIDALTRYSNYYQTVGDSKKALDLRVFKDSIRQVYDTILEEQESRNEILLFQTNEIIHKNEKQQQLLVYSSRINTLYMMAIILFIGLIAISIFIIYKLKSNNKLLRKEIDTLSAPAQNSIAKEKKEVTKPSVKPNSKKWRALFEKAEQVVKAQELFRNPELKKQDLAVILETNGTYLSSCINANAKVNYNEWINGLRIDYIAERLRDTSQIETLCKEAGFSSQSVFYKSFKKKLNCTPGEYLQKQVTPK